MGVDGRFWLLYQFLEMFPAFHWKVFQIKEEIDFTLQVGSSQKSYEFELNTQNL